MTYKVLLFINNLDIGNRGGGAEIFAVKLAKDLHCLGYDVRLGVLSRFANSTEAAWIKELESNGVKCEFLGRNERRNPIKLITRAVEICKLDPPDIVHSHCQIGSMIAVWLKSHRLTHRIIRTAHPDLEWGSNLAAWFLRQVFTKWIFPMKFDAQVGVSKSITARLKSYPAARNKEDWIITIHNSLPKEFEIINPEESWGTSFPKGMYWELISVGRLTNRKGFDILINALPSVIQKFPNTHLTIVGEGTERRTLEDLIDSLHLNESVALVGRKSDVKEILLKSDIFILPSYTEGLPTVILEAIACGVPVIATRLPGVMELITDKQTGWLVEPGNVEELSRAMLNSMSSVDELVRIQRNAFEVLPDYYGFESTAQQYQQLYQRLFLLLDNLY